MIDILDWIVTLLWPAGGGKRHPLVWIAFFAALGIGLGIILTQ